MCGQVGGPGSVGSENLFGTLESITEGATPSRDISFKSVRTRSYARYFVKRPEKGSSGSVPRFAGDTLDRPTPFEKFLGQRDLFHSKVLRRRRSSCLFDCCDERATGNPKPLSELGNPRWSPGDEADSQIGFNRGG